MPSDGRSAQRRHNLRAEAPFGGRHEFIVTLGQRGPERVGLGAGQSRRLDDGIGAVLHVRQGERGPSAQVKEETEQVQASGLNFFAITLRSY